MLDHRLQILLDEERFQRISAAAREHGVSVSAVILEAIDRGVPAGNHRRHLAAQRILTAPPMPVPSPHGLRAELENVRSHHG